MAEGLLGGIDPEELRRIMQSFLPDDADKSAAMKQALLASGLRMLGARKGREGIAAADAGLLGLGVYNSGLQGASQAKKDALTQQSQLMDFATKRQGFQNQQQIGAAARASTIPGSPGSLPMGPPSPDGSMPPGLPATAPGFDYKGYANRIAAIDPMRAMQIQSALQKENPLDKFKPEHYTPESLARFSQSQNPGDLVPVAAKAENPVGKVSPSDFTAESVQRFIAGGSKDYSVLRAIDKTPRTTVTVNNQQEGEYAKTYGKAMAEQAIGYQTEAQAAQQKLRRLGQLTNLVQGLETSAATPVTMKAASAARAIGINIDPKLSQKEAADTIIGELTLSARPKGAGAMSDAELVFYQKMTPNLSMTPQGRSLTIEAVKRMEERKVLIGQLASEYAKKNRGQLDQGFNDYLAQRLGDKNMFADLEPALESIDGPAKRGASGKIGSGPSQPDVDAVMRKYLRR